MVCTMIEHIRARRISMTKMVYEDMAGCDHAVGGNDPENAD